MATQEKAVANATAGGDRIEILDALRGFALCGILIANLPVFTGWYMMPPDRQAALAAPGAAVLYDQLIKFFVDGKFYTIFSLLFGIGFTLQLDRLEKRGAAGIAVFRRRMLVLLAIGFIHMTFVWQGDILTLYAALGLLLPLFRPWKESSLLALAVFLLAVPLALVPLCAWAGIDLGHWLEGIGLQITRDVGGPLLESPIAYMESGDWNAFAAWQLSGLPFRIEHLLVTWRVPKVLGIMLLGMVLGRRLIAGTLLTDRKLLLRTLVFGLAIGIPTSLVFALDPMVYQEHWSSVLGTVPLALAYAAGFVLAWPKAKGALGIMAPVGRMALTNYLTHTLLGVLMLGVFFGIAGRLGPLQTTLVALPIIVFQIAFSRWWLARHAQGPMERLWRWGTYGAVKPR